MLIDIKNLSAFYKNRLILDEINLKINEKNFICILGENGSGKSTLLKCICSLKKYSGTIVKKPYLRMSYLPQDNILIEDLSVKDNLKLFISDRNSLNNEVIDLFDLRVLFPVKVKNLSGGMKKKLSICCCLIDEVDLLILDEPFVSLDSKAIDLIINVLNEKKDQGMSLIYTTHLDSTLYIADKKYYLSNSQLEEIEWKN